MKVKNKPYLPLWLIYLCIALAMFSLSSCSSIRKLKSNLQQSSKVDSSTVKSKTVDSSATTIIKKVDSSGISVIVTFDSTDNDSATTVEIETYPPKKEDYLQPERTTGIKVKTNRKPKSIEVKQNQKQSNEQNKTTAVSGTEKEKTNVTKTETVKKVEVNKKRFVFHWWWLLIALAVLLLYLKFKHKITPVGMVQKFVAWLGVESKSFNQNNNMKNLILLLMLSTSLFIGCVAPDKKDTTVTELKSMARPDVDLDWELAFKDTTGDYAVLRQVNGKGVYVTVKDTTWQKQIKVPRSTFLLQMSVRQVKLFLSLSNYFTTNLLLGLGCLVIVLAALIFILWKSAWHWSKPSFGVLVLVVGIIGGCIRIIQKVPAELSDLNKKPLSRAEYDYWKKVDPTFDAFWLDQWSRNELDGVTNKEAIK